MAAEVSGESGGGWTFIGPGWLEKTDNPHNHRRTSSRRSFMAHFSSPAYYGSALVTQTDSSLSEPNKTFKQN